MEQTRCNRSVRPCAARGYLCVEVDADTAACDIVVTEPAKTSYEGCKFYFLPFQIVLGNSSGSDLLEQLLHQTSATSQPIEPYVDIAHRVFAQLFAEQIDGTLRKDDVAAESMGGKFGGGTRLNRKIKYLVEGFFQIRPGDCDIPNNLRLGGIHGCLRMSESVLRVKRRPNESRLALPGMETSFRSRSFW